MKHFKRGLLCTLCLACTLALQAQEKEILALTGASAIEELDAGEYERLCVLLAAPLPLNAASPARLQSCGLLTRFQAAAIVDYRSRCGDILSAAELGLVDGFSPERAAALAPFLSFASTGKPGQPARERRHWDLQIRGDYRNRTFGYAAKARFEQEGRWSLGVTARSPASEKPGAPETWSFNATRAFRKRAGKVMLGDFNARFGQGLALWNGFSLSGLTTAESFARHPTGLSPAWSLSPDGPLRGLAADLGTGRFNCSAVAAFPGLRQRMDGNPRAAISSFGALNAGWISRSAEISATLLIAQPTSGVSSKLSADFRWTPGKIGYFGEAALDLRTKAVGAVCGLTWTPAYQRKASLVLRHYPTGFGAGLTGGVRTGSQCSGETGVSAGVTLPWLRATADYAHFHAKGYGQFRLLALTSLTYKEKYALTPRISLRWRQGTLRQEYRLETACTGAIWQAKLRADLVRCTETAWHAYAEGSCKTERWSLLARAGIFKADNWNDRIYVYERDAPGCFNVPAYYGRGFSGSLCGSLRLKRHKFFLRIGGVRYITDKAPRSEARLYYALEL